MMPDLPEPRRWTIFRDVIAGKAGSWRIADGFPVEPGEFREVVEVVEARPGGEPGEEAVEAMAEALRRIRKATAEVPARPDEPVFDAAIGLCFRESRAVLSRYAVVAVSGKEG